MHASLIGYGIEGNMFCIVGRHENPKSEYRKCGMRNQLPQ